MGSWISKNPQQEPQTVVPEEEYKEVQNIWLFEQQRQLEEAKVEEQQRKHAWLLENCERIKEEAAKKKAEKKAKRKQQVQLEQTKFLNNVTLYKVISNLDFLNELLARFKLQLLKEMPESTYTLQSISVSTKEKEVKNLFRKLSKPSFLVKNVRKIANPFLTLSYDIMKNKLKEQKLVFKEKSLYKGISSELTESVCSMNFDNDVAFRKDVHLAANLSMGTLVLTKVLFCEVPTPNEDTSACFEYDIVSYLPLYLVQYEEFQKQRSQRSKFE